MKPPERGDPGPLWAVAPYKEKKQTKWTLFKYYRYHKVYVTQFLYTVHVVEGGAEL